MGAPHVLMILVSLLLPIGILAGVWHLGRRKGWSVTARIARSPLLATLVASAACSLTLIVIATWRPSTSVASGGAEDDAPADVPRALSIYVYPLENWGGDLRREDIGATFSRTIEDALTRGGWPATKGIEAKLPLDLFQTGSASGDVLTAYRYNAPCVCIWGTISINRDGNIEALVTVSEVTPAIEQVELLQTSVSCPNAPTTLSSTAKDLARRILDVLAERE